MPRRGASPDSRCASFFTMANLLEQAVEAARRLPPPGRTTSPRLYCSWRVTERAELDALHTRDALPARIRCGPTLRFQSSNSSTRAIAVIAAELPIAQRAAFDRSWRPVPERQLTPDATSPDTAPSSARLLVDRRANLYRRMSRPLWATTSRRRGERSPITCAGAETGERFPRLLPPIPVKKERDFT